jgi:hypothetical protein
VAVAAADTGYVWAATDDGIYRLDRDGWLVWSSASNPTSQKWIGIVSP